MKVLVEKTFGPERNQTDLKLCFNNNQCEINRHGSVYAGARNSNACGLIVTSTGLDKRGAVSPWFGHTSSSM